MLVPILLSAQIQDRHLSSTVEKYFARNRTAPTIISAEVVDDIMYGRTLKIRIQGHRNSENEDLGFAFGAAAAVANQASNKLEALWIEMDVRYKAVETTVAVAPALCSIEAIVYKSRSFGEWWENCLEIL
ncbi:MAG: hypothetical protein H8E26_13260 [FCB group bacterium]|nr:hypothetical protein [FCB group bacterium]MBL7028770.1 hypothetical protein [Candidatus Neomarinimicrobiota bacterium]MBL7121346.1 hypothetical protein [Candidatus Neomarinimicrobiota bacterium]